MLKLETYSGDILELARKDELIEGWLFEDVDFTPFFQQSGDRYFGNCTFRKVSVKIGNAAMYIGRRTFKDCHFEGCSLFWNALGCTFENCTFEHDEFELPHANWSFLGHSNIEHDKHSIAAGVDGQHCPSFFNCTFEQISFVSVENSYFASGKFKHCLFIESIERSDFTSCNFSGCNFTGTKFDQTSLADSRFEEAYFGSDTEFKKCHVHGMSISRLDLSGLKDFGGLTVGELKTMKITHDLAELRRTFSGFLQWLHIIAIFSFVFPFMWFTATKLVAAAANQYQKKLVLQLEKSHEHKAPSNPIDDAIQAKTTSIIERQEVRLNTIQEYPLALQIIYYVASGGATNRIWKPDGIYLAMFSVVLIYNILRGYLLWFTKKLEHEEIVTELPSGFRFSNSPIVAFSFTTMNWLFYGTVFATLYSIVRFSLYSVPL